MRGCAFVSVMGGADKARQLQAPDTSAFDQWLSLSLRRKHNVVLTEPVPEAMLCILALSDQLAHGAGETRSSQAARRNDREA
jgi:hypothetical protein